MNVYGKTVLAAIVASTLVLVGCTKGSSPLAPEPLPAVSTPVATTISATLPVINKFTGQPVNGWSVTGAVAATNVAGSVKVNDKPGSLMTIAAANYLPFDTLWGVSGRTQFDMFELRYGNTVEKVRQAIYGSNNGANGTLLNPGIRPLVKIKNGSEVVIIASGIAELDAVASAGATIFSGKSGNRAYVAQTVPAGAVKATLMIDPSITSAMATGRMATDSEGNTTEIRIKVQSLDVLKQKWAITAMVHELYHGKGLSHHDGDGIMGMSWNLFPDLTLDEVDDVAILTALNVGTNEVYNDRGVAKTSSTLNVSSASKLAPNEVMCALNAPVIIK